ncbi:MAG: bifunctional metallophosphatase/5'-nucleotidase [Pseudomonadota bacterium]
MPRAPDDLVEINLVALNDLHGNLEASKFNYVSASDAQTRSVSAGGVDTLAAALQAWRKEDRELLLVGAGDMIGASPAMSSLWADEPTIGALDRLGLRATSVGNHEFDAGRAELLRQQRGGCQSPRPEAACKLALAYDGARFTYLAANVIDAATGQPFLPAYRIEQAHGVKVAFIGAVLKDTASAVLASGVAGLDFVDEADAINRVLPALRAQGVGVFVVLIHQGGRTTDYFDQADCANLSGPIVDVVKRLDPAIRLVVSGHSHTGFLCRVDGRLVTQAEMGGHVLSRIKLSVDRASNRVRAVSASNVVMTPGAYPADPDMDAYLAQVRQRSHPVLARPVARIGVPSVPRTRSAGGESPLGDLVADAMLAATRGAGAQIAFMNNGGMRRELNAGADLVASYAHVQAVLPFRNTMVVMTLTGAQIRALLEQQWPNQAAEEGEVLQVSQGFRYRWDGGRPAGQRVLADSVTLDGVALADDRAYRVVVNNFLAEGGDHFSLFLKGGARIDTGLRDLDVLSAYLADAQANGRPAGSITAAGRIVRLPSL